MEDVVSQVMSKTVRTIGAEDDVSSVLKMMIKYGIGSVVMVEGKGPTAIVTERDVVRRLSNDGYDVLEAKVADIASKPLITVSPSTEIWVAFRLMVEKHVRRLPVIDGGKLVGIVTERDLFKWVVKVTYEPNIPDSLKRLIAQNP